MRALSAWSGGRQLIPTVWLAETAPERMQGLLGRPQLSSEEAMLIRPCRLIHTVGMQYALDIVFLDASNRIRKLTRSLKPRRMAGCVMASQTLELRAGMLDRLNLALGDQIEWKSA